jgi:CBS domain-containing protein
MTPNPLRRTLQGLAVAGVLTAGGCGELTTVPADAPTVQALTLEAVAGSSILLRLHNPTDVTWSFTGCPGAFQRFDGGEWVDLPPAFILCTADVPLISPDETVDIGAFLMSEAPAGTYRAVVVFENGGTDVTRTSGTIEVTALPIGTAPTVSILEASADPGDEVTVRIMNTTSLTFSRNLCADARLQRLEGDEWVDTAAPLWVCTSALYPIAPGAFADEAYPVFADLTAGTYRMRVRLWRESADAVTRFSNSFTVN